MVRGSGDVGSAVAHRLFTGGYGVVIHDLPLPTATRRKMAFADAIFEGSVMLEGVQAKRINRLSLVRGILIDPQFIPVLIGDFNRVMEKLHPHVLVDARMRKHSLPEKQIRLAPFVIGLGPNFTAGQTVHSAIETAWGENLGNVITSGSTNPLEGRPVSIEGRSRDRYVYAPVAGKFHTSLKIGDQVSEGQEVARVGATPLLAPITGILRGLTHDGVPVEMKTKVIEVDPRMEHPQISGIALRPAKIAEGVLAAIQTWEANHVH
ncbi:MAG: EF2563 family selenium-dependent molybdenum hydroxylase system protein [Chloroflexi bacterium]|nr:EF2563 family selenium-dependent molybdenum hydroxylase system protein [Chloroflexota bacterium]